MSWWPKALFKWRLSVSMNSSRRWDRLICDFSVWYLVYFSWQSTKGQKNKAEIRLLITLRLFFDNWGVWQQATLPFFLHIHEGYSPIPLIVSAFQSIASFSCILFPLMKTQGRKKRNCLFVWAFIWSDVHFLFLFFTFLSTDRDTAGPSVTLISKYDGSFCSFRVCTNNVAMHRYYHQRSGHSTRYLNVLPALHLYCVYFCQTSLVA